MIDPTILGLLRDCDLHGYELKKRISDLMGNKQTTSWGTLYPALAKLEAQGALKAVEIAHSSGPTVPMTGSLGGEAAAFGSIRRAIRGVRGKKVYSLTPNGWRRFLEFLADRETDERDFRIKVAFARHLDPAARLDLFQRQLIRLESHSSERKTSPDGGTLDKYIDSIRHLESNLDRAEINWLTELIAHEKSTIQSFANYTPQEISL